MITIVIIFLAALLLADIYLWNSFVKGSRNLWTALYWLPTALLLVFTAINYISETGVWAMYLMFILVVTIGLPKVFFALLSLIGQLLDKWVRNAYEICSWIGAFVAVIISTGMIIGLTIGWKHLEVDEEVLTFENLPESFDGYRIALISDLHLGTYGKDTSFIEKMVEKVNSLDVDAVFHTGDIVNLVDDELVAYLDILSGITARDGVYSVLGNHDYCPYARHRTDSLKAESSHRIIEYQKSMGWKVLINESARICTDSAAGECIAVAGVECAGKPPFPSRADLPATLSGISDSTFTILLSHDPSYWNMEIVPDGRVDLTLSGHTHAMQLKIFGLSPARLIYPEWSGTYTSDEGGKRQVLHITEGLGGTVPFRLGATPEIKLLTLLRP